MQIKKTFFLFDKALKSQNNQILTEKFFDTIKIKPKIGINAVKAKAEEKKINLRYFPDEETVIICNLKQ